MKLKRRKRRIIRFVVIALLLLIVLTVAKDYFFPDATPISLNVVDSNVSVAISSAFVAGKQARVDFENNSKIPITLISTNLSCKDGYAEEVVFGIEFDRDKKQYVPVKIEEGESKMLLKQIGRTIPKDGYCDIEVKHFSRYGVEE